MRCTCRDGRTLDQLLMDYLLFGDPTTPELIAEKNPTREKDR